MGKKLFMIIAVAMLLSCEKPNDKVVIGQKLTTLLNAEVFEQLTIEDNSFVLEAYLWRDFMPVSPEDGKPMIALNWLVDVNSAPIPDNISMVKQYVIYNDSIWVADYEDEAPTPDLPEYKMERISRNGPKWGPKIHVDIVSQIYDSKTDTYYYIGLKDVYVIHTS